MPGDPRLPVRHPTDSPLQAHHRKSAAWPSGPSEPAVNLGASLYRDREAVRGQGSRVSYSSRNRAKVEYRRTERGSDGRPAGDLPAAATRPTRPPRAAAAQHQQAGN